MSEEKIENGENALDNISLDQLKSQAQNVETAKAEEPKKEEPAGDSVFDFGDDTKAEAAPVPAAPKTIAETAAPDVKAEPTKEELGGGIIIEEDPNAKKPEDGIKVGPMAGETQENVAKTMQEMDQMIDIAKKVSAAKGEVVKTPDLTVEVLMDKTGMSSVEFTAEEKEKMSVAKKINVVEIDTKKLASLKVNKPKALKAKTLIQKTFDRQYASFVAAASGYLGKMRNMSSLEVINLITINANAKNSTEALMQKASLIYEKLKEASIGEFESFDDFCKKTAVNDLNVMVYALIRATYPDEEEIVLNCANPKCVHKEKDAEGKVIEVPNQFTYKYKNTELILTKDISEKLRTAAQNIYEHQYTIEDANTAAQDAPIYNSKTFALDEDQRIIVTVHCPTIYTAAENVTKRIDMSEIKDKATYQPAIELGMFVENIMLADDETGEYNQYTDIENIVEIIYNMTDDELEVLSQIISDNVLDYQYKYGFKAENVVCPHCGQPFKNDVEVEIDRLLFIQVQRHTING